jgi:uncharacterized membrane protein
VSTDIVAETVIARPRDEVAAYVIDWRNDPRWIGGISEARLVSGEPFGVGSKVARTASFLGKRIEYVNEVVELEPDSRLVMRSVKGPFPMRITYAFHDADPGTRATVRVEGNASGFYRLAGPALSAMVRRSVSGDLARLKRLLESR